MAEHKLSDIKVNHSSKQESTASFPRSVLLANRSEITNLSLRIEGNLPPDLMGHLYIMGSAGSLDSLAVKDHTHLVAPAQGNGISIFNGDGMIYRIDFEDNNVLLTTRLVKTPCYYLDQAISREDESSLNLKFQSIGLMRFSPSLGVRVQGNTACLPIQFNADAYPRMILASDTGRPYEIDPKTLEVITPIGSTREWKDVKMPMMSGPLKMFGSAAHPVFDPSTQEFFTVNWSKSIKTMLQPVDLSMDSLEELIENLPKFINKKHRKIKTLKFLATTLNLDDWIYFFQEKLFREGEMSDFFKPYVPAELFSALKEIERNIFSKSIKSIDELLNNIVSMLDEAAFVFEKAREMEDFVYLLRWTGDHSLQSWKVFTENEGHLNPVQLENSLHQIGITEDYLVLMDTSFKVGINQVFGKNLPKWEGVLKILRDQISHSQSLTPKVYFIRRSDLETEQGEIDQPAKTVIAKQISLPQEVAHFAVDYGNPNGHVTLHVSHNCAWDPAEWVQPYDEFSDDHSHPVSGFSVGSMDINKLGKYVVDVEAETITSSHLVSDSDLTWSTAIYTHSPDFQNKKIENMFWLSWGSWQELKTSFIINLYKDYSLREVPLDEVLSKTLPSNIIRLDTNSMVIADAYQFPRGCFANSPQFIPCSEAAHNFQGGYIAVVVITANNQTLSDTEFWIFDASQLSNGPICKLSHPKLKLGITIHSTWIPTAQPRQADYMIPIQDDYASLLSEESPALRQLFEDYVFPNFQSGFSSPYTDTAKNPV